MKEIHPAKSCGRMLSILLVIAMSFGLVACNGFEETAYKTIKSAAVAYDSAMQIAADHYKSMDDAEDKAAFWAKVESVAKPVHASLVTAKTACEAYSKATAAYDSAKAAAGESVTTEEQSTIDRLSAEAVAAKAAASAALDAVDVSKLADSIRTIINLF